MRMPVFCVSNPVGHKQAVQPQKMVRGLKFWIMKVEGLFYVTKTKALINCVVSAHLISTFVFVYAKSKFSHDMAHIPLIKSPENIVTIMLFS